mmetsp:Transcript_526/g.1027  ORF Transcript_526/g.1027 Transcript_526/m.1027 type:complete len:356 (-) Transcript_526:141-1208(-)
MAIMTTTRSNKSCKEDEDETKRMKEAMTKMIMSPATTTTITTISDPVSKSSTSNRDSLSPQQQPNVTDDGIDWCHESSLEYEKASGDITPVKSWSPVAPIGDDENENAAPAARCSGRLVCFGCGVRDDEPKRVVRISRCARCGFAAYCGKKCQVADWKGKGKYGGIGHKHSCASYKDVGINMDFGDGELKGDLEERREATVHRKRAAVVTILRRIRFYMCPFAVYNASIRGRGFVFLQSPCTLAVMSLPDPVDSDGLPVVASLSPPRAVLMHFLTLGEYDSEVCRDDFEMAICRNELQNSLDAYDEQREVVVCARFRCGNIFVFVAPLVPEFGICVALASDYEGKDALQLNIDDM